MTHTQTQGADGADDAGTEWFWRIVDANGLGNVPSDETEALRLLCTKAAWYDEGQSASTIPPGVRSLLRTARSGLATYGAGAFEGTILQIDAILAYDPIFPAPAATPGVPDSLREAFAAATDSPVFVHDFADPAVSSAPGCQDVSLSFVTPDHITAAFMGNGLAGTIDQARKDAVALAAAWNHVRALIAAQPAGQAGDAGAGRLPDEPTEEMYKAALPWFGSSRFHFEEMYRAILSTAPDSTRTGAAEMELTERDIEAPIYEAFARYVGNADERASDFRMFATGYHAALAARPEAPSDAGWSFDMEAAPRDGTPINVGRDNGCGWDLLVVWWSKSASEYPWHTEGGGEYPEHRFDCWATLTPPSDPAPSGQAEG